MTVLILPNRSTVLAITPLIASSSAPSATIGRTCTPYSSSSFFWAFSSLERVLPVMTRFEPSLAKAVARPNPIPFSPPVMMVTFPSNLFVFVIFVLSVNKILFQISEYFGK